MFCFVTIIVASSQVVVGPGGHPGQAKALTTLRGVRSLHRPHLKGRHTLYLQETEEPGLGLEYLPLATKAQISV